jgi:hypothetical protein
MYEENYLKKAMFSLFLSDSETNSSKMWFGGYSRSFLRSFIEGANIDTTDEEIDSAIQWIALPDHETQWTVPFQSAKFFFDTEVVDFEISSAEIQFDSGATFSEIPEADFNTFLRIANQQAAYDTCTRKPDTVNGGEAVYCRCIPANVKEDPWPVLSMKIGPSGESSSFSLGAEHYFSYPELYYTSDLV